MSLTNQVALITGAGGPMGQAIAKRFYKEGAKLVLTDISENRLLQTVNLLTEENEKGAEDIVYLRRNVLEYEEVKEVVEKGVGQFQQIDILVNVVGGIRSKKWINPF